MPRSISVRLKKRIIVDTCRHHYFRLYNIYALNARMTVNLFRRWFPLHRENPMQEYYMHREVFGAPIRVFVMNKTILSSFLI